MQAHAGGKGQHIRTHRTLAGARVQHRFRDAGPLQEEGFSTHRQGVRMQDTCRECWREGVGSAHVGSCWLEVCPKQHLNVTESN